MHARNGTMKVIVGKNVQCNKEEMKKNKEHTKPQFKEFVSKNFDKLK